ncbi:CLUMA_CG006415, isoform A [Clunio marinus]|uniref:CLUMA_CG006415, isoform A n=1 Tax=Clunio marinus TaxID=568069 RepID=A0A1J1HXQ5_9DIPT|nr:CLUMA_CG006415, isoform A [Clunio marinus]
MPLRNLFYAHIKLDQIKEYKPGNRLFTAKVGEKHTLSRDIDDSKHISRYIIIECSVKKVSIIAKLKFGSSSVHN